LRIINDVASTNFHIDLGLFQGTVAVSTHHMDRVVTNDLTQDSLDATQEVCGMRWKIGQFASLPHLQAGICNI
jgi:hypothetical protein